MLRELKEQEKEGFGAKLDVRMTKRICHLTLPIFVCPASLGEGHSGMEGAGRCEVTTIANSARWDWTRQPDVLSHNFEPPMAQVPIFPTSHAYDLYLFNPFFFCLYMKFINYAHTN